MLPIRDIAGFQSSEFYSSIQPLFNSRCLLTRGLMQSPTSSPTSSRLNSPKLPTSKFSQRTIGVNRVRSTTFIHNCNGARANVDVQWLISKPPGTLSFSTYSRTKLPWKTSKSSARTSTFLLSPKINPTVSVN